MNSDLTEPTATTALVQAARSLLRDLIASYLCKPQSIDIEWDAHPGVVYFRVTVAGYDQPAAVGRQGTHIRALTSIFAEYGRQNGLQFVVWLNEPEDVADRAAYKRPIAPNEYDPTPSGKLLARLLDAVGVGQYAIETESSSSKYDGQLAFRHKVYIRASEDYRRMTFNPDRPDATLVGAIGTLFRASATRDGVRVLIALVDSSKE